MWEATESSLQTLQSWVDSFGDDDLKMKTDKLLKKSRVIFDYDEIMEILGPLAADYPVYKFVDGMRHHVQKEERVPNPEYETRIRKLRIEQENKEYRKMIKSVDPSQLYGRDPLFTNFGEELKIANRQVIAIFNTLLTVAGGFCFGFYGIGFAYPSWNLSTLCRIVIGLIIGLIVFVADLYFIIKGMDETDTKHSKMQKSGRGVLSTNGVSENPEEKKEQ